MSGAVDSFQCSEMKFDLFDVFAPLYVLCRVPLERFLDECRSILKVVQLLLQRVNIDLLAVAFVVLVVLLRFDHHDLIGHQLLIVEDAGRILAGGHFLLIHPLCQVGG